MANQPPLTCPHCGCLIEKPTAIACPNCGADEHTAWGYLSEHPMDSIPTGWSQEDDFSYDEFLEKEFGKTADLSKTKLLKNIGLILLLLFIISYLVF